MLGCIRFFLLITILEFADDKKSVFFLQTYIGTLEVIIEFKLRRAERDNWPEGFTDTVTKFLKKLEEMETFAIERCGKNYSRVRNGLLEKDNFKADFFRGCKTFLPQRYRDLKFKMMQL